MKILFCVIAIGDHRGDCRWNEDVQGKVEAKKVAYTKLVESKDKEDKRTHMERYKAANKEERLAVVSANTIEFECLYKELRDKGGDTKLYRLVDQGEGDEGPRSRSREVHQRQE